MNWNNFDNQYIITYGWMARLNLPKNEQIILSLVYGYNITGRNYYIGDASHLSKWTCSPIGDVLDAIKSLVDKNLLLIIKENDAIQLIVQDPRITQLADYKKKKESEQT